MKALYEPTSLTPMRVARESGYLDWSWQPSLFKHYPDFLFSYNYSEIEALHLVELARMISATKEIAAKPYHQLTTPSAGNLHPVELYLQIRGVKGLLSGIYHVDAQKERVVLIQEIESDGLEASLGVEGSLQGMIFVITTVPFRAEWKYKGRAIRYCYLDVGHQIATLASSAKLYEKNLTILSNFDKAALNELMGFKKEESVSAVAYIGEIRKRDISRLKESLMYVAPTEYSELTQTLAHNIAQAQLFQSQRVEIEAPIQEQEIFQRRSARFFDRQGRLDKESLEYFMEYASSLQSSLSCYIVLLSDKHKKRGIYLKNQLIKEGDFTETISKLLVDQRFVKNADMIFVVTSHSFSANSLMNAAIFVHNLYMLAQTKELGCSGIGAFYDKKMQNFLSTDEYILYVSAIGVDKC